jgi:membrane dipeptidase
MPKTPVVDAHLDMAGNVLGGRDYDLTAPEVRAAEQRERTSCMVTLRELERGNVAVTLGTLFVGTATFDDDGVGIYKTDPTESALRQLDVYLGWEADGKARIIRSRADLDGHMTAWETDGKVGVVILIEGGDSIETPDALPAWFERGVRVIGPAWSATRYCGGTRREGPLTDMGRELVAGMKELGVILDVSHMAEESFWQAMDVGYHRVIATHANVRAIVPTHRPERHLSDEMLAALGKADGCIGVVPANAFLDDSEWGVDRSGPPLTLAAVKKHLDHMAAIVGWERVGIGSDLDGGFGVEETPVELDSAADLVKIGDVVAVDAREGVLGRNWLRVLSESLPSGDTPEPPGP